MKDQHPASGAERYPAVALSRPFRAILGTLFVAALCVQAVDIFTGDYLRGALIGIIAALAIIVWRLAERGALESAALLMLAGMATLVTLRLWFGHGPRDFGIAVYPAVLFLGCVFLQSRAYWALAALVLIGALAVGAGEVTGVRPGSVRGAVQAASLVNLAVILVATAVGGRVLLYAVRTAFAREHALSGALANAEERMQKIFRSSQNAIVVSRMADGRYLEVNDAYLEMFGYAREEIIGRTSAELGIWEDARERERFVRELLPKGVQRRFETRLRRKSGELFEVQLSAERLDLDAEPWLVISVADITIERAARRRAQFLATRDPLSGLPNRALALDRLERAVDLARRTQGLIGVLQVGIDRFSAVNESLGRGAGDELLREICARLESLLRPGDTLARLGGDELIYIAEGMPAPAQVDEIAGRLHAAFEAPFTLGTHTLHLSCSIGACRFPDDADEAELLLRYADSATRVAKAEGRGRTCHFERVMVERVRDRLLVQSGLRQSIARGELRLAYQPKFNLQSGALTGLEALARWTHPELGSISPTRFIAIAEESDLILELGSWVLGETCSQLVLWEAEARQPVAVAVNLSARELNPRLPGLIAESISAHELDPGLLEFEVTESMLITEPEATRRVLEQVSARGSHVVLDDFGVGYSSLGYVKHLPLDGIKIDRSFVHDIAVDRHDAAIVGAIVGLAHGLGIRVVAEGIENQSQIDALRAIGCDEGQGFLLGRPVPGEEIRRLLRARAGQAAVAR